MSTGADQEGPHVLHLDMDSFYVAVEVQRDPSLAGKPVVVGGTGSRGVVASASYEARAFGIRSAMPSMRARSLCPQAIFLHGDHRRYGEVSRALHDILHSVTPNVEPIALDEAFLDVAGARRIFGNGEQIAWMLRNRVHDELGLDCSVGVAPNKLLAKLASEAAKPRAHTGGVRPGLGVKLVTERNAMEFLHAHPIRALWGVGPRTHERLSSLGVATVGDLAKVPPEALVASVGVSHGEHLAALARGDDPRPVVSGRDTKSIGHEETFSDDLFETSDLRRIAVRLAEAVASRLRKAELAARTVQLKLRFADFTLITRSKSVDDEVTTGHQMMVVVDQLLALPDVADRISSIGVRLLGVSTSGLGAPTGVQLSLDQLMSDEPSRSDHQSKAGSSADGWHDVSDTLDAIRERFGDDAIVPGASVADVGKRERTAGTELWGPAEAS